MRKSVSETLVQSVGMLNEAIIIFELINRRPVIVYCNKSLKKILGYAPNLIIGNDFSFFNTSGSTRENLKKLDAAFKKNQKQMVDLMIEHKTGRKVFTRTSINPLKNKDGKIDLWVCVLRDITEARDNLIRDLKLETVKQTLATINDVVFNYLHGLALFRMHCEEIQSVSQVRLKEFDIRLNEIVVKLKKINEMHQFREKKLSDQLSVFEIDL